MNWADFTDVLMRCEEILRSMDHLTDLNNPTNMRAIWKILPKYLQDRWYHKNYQIRKDGKCRMELKNLVKFIVESAEEATGPIFSRFCDKGSDSNPVKKSINTNLIQAPTGERKNKKCCEYSNYLSQCAQFRASCGQVELPHLFVSILQSVIT